MLLRHLRKRGSVTLGVDQRGLEIGVTEKLLSHCKIATLLVVDPPTTTVSHDVSTAIGKVSALEGAIVGRLNCPIFEVRSIALEDEPLGSRVV